MRYCFRDLSLDSGGQVSLGAQGIELRLHLCPLDCDRIQLGLGLTERHPATAHQFEDGVTAAIQLGEPLDQPLALGVELGRLREPLAYLCLGFGERRAGSRINVWMSFQTT